MDRTLELLKLAKDGDQDAKEQLITENLGLVWAVARRFMGRGHELEDLYQIGCIGLMKCIDNAYDDKFDVKDITQIVRADGQYYLELFHGKTIAFKDMALSILPHLLITSAKKNNVKNDIVILTATSGDTGKAALEGFADVDNTQIIVFYPKDGVSPIQEKQMVTQKGKNTHVIGIKGNFDDAQNGVKEMFNDEKLAKELEKNGYQFSSANSINIGRLVPQIVYYVYAYAVLVGSGEIKNGEVINVTVPT